MWNYFHVKLKKVILSIQNTIRLSNHNLFFSSETHVMIVFCPTLNALIFIFHILRLFLILLKNFFLFPNLNALIFQISNMGSKNDWKFLELKRKCRLNFNSIQFNCFRNEIFGEISIHFKKISLIDFFFTQIFIQKFKFHFSIKSRSI